MEYYYFYYIYLVNCNGYVEINKNKMHEGTLKYHSLIYVYQHISKMTLVVLNQNWQTFFKNNKINKCL